jgi:hypothetical protein
MGLDLYTHLKQLISREIEWSKDETWLFKLYESEPIIELSYA